MTGDGIGATVSILGSMILVGSALVARRERFRAHGWTMALVWVAIFVTLIVVGYWIDGHR
ncbi:MAG TPA: hypothetical protein VGC10_03265 [Sphingomonas sp.]